MVSTGFLLLLAVNLKMGNGEVMHSLVMFNYIY